MSDSASQMATLLSAVATLTDEVTSLKRTIGDLQTKVDATKELVEAWQAVKTGGKFVKWVAGVGSGIAGAWIVMKALGSAMVK